METKPPFSSQGVPNFVFLQMKYTQRPRESIRFCQTFLLISLGCLVNLAKWFVYCGCGLSPITPVWNVNHHQ